MAGIKMWALGLLICGGCGFVFLRVGASWQRHARRRMLAEVDGTLSMFATAMRGQFQPGRVKIADHPMLGEIRDYGTAEIEVRGLRAVVGVEFPSGDSTDDQTRIRVLRPPGRSWRVQALELRARPARGADPDSAAAFARSFEVTPPASVPDPARAALMRLAVGATEIEIENDALSFLAVSEDRTVYVADQEQLRALVDQVTNAATLLLAPS